VASARSSGSGIWAVGFAGAALMNLLSVAGLADSIVEWRCFLQIDQIIATYQALKAFLFALLPIRFPDWLKDYAVVTASFSVMLNLYGRLAEKKSVARILADTEGLEGVAFRVFLYTIPWLVLLWFAFRHMMWRTHFEKLKRLIGADPALGSELDSQRQVQNEKARILSRTVIGYPIICLALLFTFSDFAYTLFDTSQIGGITFRQECRASGDIIRMGD
jgi:hypothetical protein